MEKSKFSFQQIIQYCYDSTVQALRVSLVPFEMVLELSHKKGDSIHSVPIQKKMKGMGIMDISDCRVISIYNGSALISPDESDEVWVRLLEGVHLVSACRVKSDDEKVYIIARS